MSARYQAVLDGITRVVGIRSAALVMADDGVVVAEASMAGAEAGAAAALASSLTGRLGRALGAAGQEPPALLHLEGEDGHLMARPLDDGLLLVAVADPAANVSLLRLALLDAGEKLV